MSDAFKEALQHVQNPSASGPSLSNHQKLQFYALFKQVDSHSVM